MIRLEGLAAELRGKRSLIIVGNNKLPDLHEFTTGSTDRGLFLHGKKIHDPLSMHWMSWAAIISVTRPVDFMYALSYLNTLSKPAFCMADQSIALPDGFLTKIGTTGTTLCKLQDVAQPFSVNNYDYIFFPVAPTDAFIAIIQANPVFASKGDLKEIFRELSVAGLGLAWDNIDKSFYWYEPGARPTPATDLTTSQIGTMLISIGQKML